MKRIRGDCLQPGDIILTTTTAAASKAIRFATRSDISHAIVCVQSHSVIDATAEGVQARNTQRLFFEDDCALHALRHRGGLTPQQTEAICNFVRSQIGTQYATREAVRTVFGGGPSWTAKQFCSRLVAQAFNAAGIQLVPDPNYCSPAELQLSEFLIEIPDCVEPVSDDEFAMWQRHPDSAGAMRRATNALLDGVRQTNPAIQTLTDLDIHLMRNPEDDAPFCKILHGSGYLIVWQAERQRNLWQYDLRAMHRARAPEAELLAYCRQVLRDEQNGPNRFAVNRGQYAQLQRCYGLQFFHLLKELSQLLATLHRLRIDTATKWLQAKGYEVPMAVTAIQPHSPDWFAALDVWDPPQAAMTRMAISTATRPDVCSICGDDPAADYRLDRRTRAPAGIDTLRLCEDCHKHRLAFGEVYFPLT
jgi:hypothetical protein